ncbi:hypothetical protein AAFF_G00039550 [Aldrovandia affinis]|uniref:Uncharacterized protein n=1 Tax=Aldrovandia affinis TaxID=143900 RepID=A0AAD7S2Y0_9TELE|nr:hypothetical protein AAFF_G00039550 [Aldrovandia affinis]
MLKRTKASSPFRARPSISLCLFANGSSRRCRSLKVLAGTPRCCGCCIGLREPDPRPGPVALRTAVRNRSRPCLRSPLPRERRRCLVNLM